MSLVEIATEPSSVAIFAVALYSSAGASRVKAKKQNDMIPFYYALTVIIWGTTWIAIKFQLGVIAVEASIAYRFALASAIFFLFLSVTKRLSWIPLRQQPHVIAQGCCLFSFNFVCFYLATDYIPSGLVAVVFSTAAIFNSAIAFLVYGRRPSGQTLLAVFVGTLGVFFLFFPPLTAPNSGARR